MTTRFKSETDIIALLQRRINDLASRLADPEQFFPEPWREIGATGNPVFAGSWVNFGGSDSTAAFRRERGGIVRLKGTVKTGSGTIFTLPTGYRPAMITNVGVYATGAGRITIGTDGVVALADGTSTRVTLDGVTFVIA
jgi:hypothetical protein